MDACGDARCHDPGVSEPGQAGTGEQYATGQQRPARPFLSDLLGQLLGEPLAADERANGGAGTGKDRGGTQAEGRPRHPSQSS